MIPIVDVNVETVDSLLLKALELAKKEFGPHSAVVTGFLIGNIRDGIENPERVLSLDEVKMEIPITDNDVKRIVESENDTVMLDGFNTVTKYYDVTGFKKEFFDKVKALINK